MYKLSTKKERESTALGRFELVCEAYINGNQQQREIILSMLNESERQTFLTGCGLYHLFIDHRFYAEVKNAVGVQLYNELHKQAETV